MSLCGVWISHTPWAKSKQTSLWKKQLRTNQNSHSKITQAIVYTRIIAFSRYLCAPKIYFPPSNNDNNHPACGTPWQTIIHPPFITPEFIGLTLHKHNHQRVIGILTMSTYGRGKRSENASEVSLRRKRLWGRNRHILFFRKNSSCVFVYFTKCW